MATSQQSRTPRRGGDRLRRAAWLCGLAPSELAAVATGEEGAANGADLVELRSLLVCPGCHGELEWKGREIECLGCSRVYPLEDGIPVLLPPEIGAADPHKEQQASFFDSADPEFEITRPHGTSWMYRSLLGEKFYRSLSGLPSLPERPTAVAICGGSGMDAEFLARAGCRVFSVDISLEAAVRARVRAERFGLDMLAVVADVEALPFRDRSVDLAYVHDGLHHLESPGAGLREMARLTAWALSVNEPARAALTSAAIKLRLSVEFEEAGNRVERVSPDELVAALQDSGFRIERCERYAMLYRHEPGRFSRLLSAPPLRIPTRVVLALVDRVLGPIGNKLTVQAVRDDTVAS